MGKNLGDDLREGKATLPLIAAMERGSAEQRALIRAPSRTARSSELDHVIAIVRATGALEVAREAARAEAQRACQPARAAGECACSGFATIGGSSLLQRRN